MRRKAVNFANLEDFHQKKIKGRINARNPKSGQIIQTKDKNSISFKMSKELMNEINTKEREIN